MPAVQSQRLAEQTPHRCPPSRASPPLPLAQLHCKFGVNYSNPNPTTPPPNPNLAKLVSGLSLASTLRGCLRIAHQQTHARANSLCRNLCYDLTCTSSSASLSCPSRARWSRSKTLGWRRRQRARGSCRRISTHFPAKMHADLKL